MGNLVYWKGGHGKERKKEASKDCRSLTGRNVGGQEKKAK